MPSSFGSSRVRGLVADRYGDWRDVRVGEVEVPPPGPGEVAIAAAAAALNFPDLLMIAGKYQHKPPPPFTPGRDVAGTVVAVGDGPTDFAMGDRVAAQPPHGAFAERVNAPASYCVRLPDGVTFQQGAAAGTVLATVVAALKLRGRLVAGETLLVTGATGGVGSAAIGYAKWLGARVVALVSSDAKEAAARAFGADLVVRSDVLADLKADLRPALAALGIDGVEVVIDVVGGAVLDAAIRCMKPEGRYVVVGFASGTIPSVAANYLLLKDIALIGSSLDRLFRSGDPTLRAGVDAAFEALAAGDIKVPIDAVLPLSDFAKGARMIAERTVIGKIVLETGAEG